MTFKIWIFIAHIKKTSYASSFSTFQLTTIIVQILTDQVTTWGIYVVVFNRYVVDVTISLFEGILLMQDSILNASIALKMYFTYIIDID